VAARPWANSWLEEPDALISIFSENRHPRLDVA
jgi:hypothetical protein